LIVVHDQLSAKGSPTVGVLFKKPKKAPPVSGVEARAWQLEN
jgi:hypothetical protein